MNPASLSVVARRFEFVRETQGANAGYWVNLFQRFAGGQEGDSWCCDFVSFVEDVAYKGDSPSKRTGSCQEKLDHARAHGWEVQTPLTDDLCFSVNGAGHAHHVAIITAGPHLSAIAGNTSEDGVSSDGTGVFEHLINPANKVFVRLPK